MSLRLKLLNGFLRTFVKPRLARLSQPARARADLARAARWVFRDPPLSLYLPVALAPGQSGLRIANRPSRLPARRRIILYLHGGAYIAGSPQTHAKLLARLSRLTGLEVLAPAYRLAPEHPFPAAFDDALAAFNHLTSHGYRPRDIILGGDSAGGGLALALLAHLSAEARHPRAAFAFSPLVDLRFKGASFAENAARDPLLPASGKARVLRMYLAGQPPDDPRASPLLARFNAPPPVFLQSSEIELLRDDSARMARHLRRSGGLVVEDIWPDTPHVWVMFDGWLPEARTALQRVADFIAET